MSVAAHHNDWLTLVEVSGPFLSLPILVDALPGGLDKLDRDLIADLWHAFAEWTEDEGGGATDPQVHHAWVRYVVEWVLGYDADVLVDQEQELAAWTVEVAEHDTKLCPSMAIREPGQDDGSPLLLIDLLPPDVSVTQPASGEGWSASPAERMEVLLKGVGARLGLVTNGEQWTMVHVAEGENTGFATWYASLWREERLTLRAFTALLGMKRFFAVAESETLQALLDRSREDQQGVTTQLGKQVRRAIEILIQQVDRVDHDRDGRLLEGMSEQRLYEAAVTVMMRLIFLFYAEENELLLLGDEFYDETYAASTLREQLQATADENGEEILERFHDAWPRLLSTFRAVYAGVEHEQMRLPAYGGDLFAPDRYPFLEGREPNSSWETDPADPLPIDNRTVLHLLNAIQTLEVKVTGGGRENRPLSFRALDVEQIGHVYETLLDHTAVRADDWVFGLEGTKDKEPEVPLRELEARADDPKELLKYLNKETGRSAGALKKRVAAEDKAVYERWGHRWKPAFGGDEDAAANAARWGLLVREDSAEYPVVVSPGHVYVTESEQRRSSGTHYTPKSLTEEIVTHTLEPLVYEGPAEGRERGDWQLRKPNQILDLKVCDPACGSGAFLVQACRYLADRLVESWGEHEATEGSDGHALPVDPEERLVVARRYVADRCLYGVDINPLATEMAKLSLWLITLQKNRPFTFLDHAIRTGDSLLGVTDFETLETFGVSKGQTQLWSQSWAPQLKAGREAREELRSFSVIDAKDVEHKRDLLRGAADEIAELRLIADVVAGVQLASSGLTNRDTEALRGELGELVALAFGQGDPSAHDVVVARARELLNTDLPSGESPRRPLHWVLEFPELVQGSGFGFDAVVGNPPFVGGTYISGSMGDAYRDYLSNEIAVGSTGRADYVAFFFLRAAALLRAEGYLGFVATSSVAEGASARVGLGRLRELEWRIYRAVRSTPWPGPGATLDIAKVWLCRTLTSAAVLDGQPCREIDETLSLAPRSTAPVRALSGPKIVFEGWKIYGQGFVLDEHEVRAIHTAMANAGDVVRPYLSGQDVNSTSTQTASRWVIDFRDWGLERASLYSEALEIVERRVKPDRDRHPRKHHRERWWQYGETRPGLRAAVNRLDQIIVFSLVSKYLAPVLVDADQVFSHKLACVCSDSPTVLGWLSSLVHWLWVEELGGSRGGGVFAYSISGVFDTLAKPEGDLSALAAPMREVVSHRSAIAHERGIGLTDLYNLFHDPDVVDNEIRTLRRAHDDLDAAALAAYGWSDLVDDIGTFRETRFGRRRSVPEQAAREICDRLRELNQVQSSASPS